jgi:hypothetical protein
MRACDGRKRMCAQEFEVACIVSRLPQRKHEDDGDGHTDGDDDNVISTSVVVVVVWGAAVVVAGR